MRNTLVFENRASLIFFCFCALSLLWVVFLLPLSLGAADNSVCARVKIEILQELTLERQAFDAHMKINNGLTNITLENVGVVVTFADKDGNSVLATFDPTNTSALFFIRVNSMEGIANVDGLGTVQPSTSADIHWLIIPAPGASNGLASGTLYYVGATLTYTLGGEAHTTTVTPDYIYVKPMPEMVLDYFLPTDVYGDDAFTLEMEPIEPFTLGVRVLNTGEGVARNLKIDSAQPKIVENEQGLLIGFNIEGSEVNGAAATKSLLASFGDIQPNSSGVARWIMTCTLSGKFTEFTAEFSHADELGGEVTSLIDAVNTHFLVRDVLVDLPGRDAIRDFLAKDGGVCRVYESQSVDTVVVDQSASATLELQGQNGSEISYTLSTPVMAGFLYVRLSDPENGQKILKEVIRADGKRIKTQNAWLSTTRIKSDPWQYFVNLFDANTPGSYKLIFDDTSSQPHAPALQFIPARKGAEGKQLSFVIEASDADDTIPTLSATPLPALASFTDQGNLGNGIATGVFDWTPAIGQSGIYDVIFTASDGSLKAAQHVTLTICSADDSDCDSLPDWWEMQYFGTLDRDGTGDADKDGIFDLQEYLKGTNPTSSNAPTVPTIDTPGDGTEATTLQPMLTVINSLDPDNDPISYEFELYADPQMTQQVAAGSVSSGPGATSFQPQDSLEDNSRYTWRVRATDGLGYSQWATASFFVNTENEPPGAFNLASPLDQSETTSLAPVLQVTNSTDPDGDVLTYGFTVYGNDKVTLVASAPAIPQGTGGTTSWQVDPALNDNTWFWWQATATDEHRESTSTELASFFVNTANDAPTAPTILSPVLGSDFKALEIDLTVTNATDKDGDLLTYAFECDTVSTFDTNDKKTSLDVGEGNGVTSWHLAGLQDNTLYFWRARVSDGQTQSSWTEGRFFVNLTNDPPTAPTLNNPGQGAWVTTVTPTLEVNPSLDPDGDALRYHFEVYANQELSQLLTDGESDLPSWTVLSGLMDNSWYTWRAQAEDEHGTVSEWMQASSFFVNDNNLDDPPEITMIEPAQDLITREAGLLLSWEDSDPDSNAVIDLFYATTRPATDGKPIATGIEEDSDSAADTYNWNISGLADGTYYVYATIRDANNRRTSYAPGAVTIDRTPPIARATPTGGTYSTAQSIALSANEAVTLYYTLDGTTPTTASLCFTTAIQIVASTTVKVLAVDRAGNASTVLTQSYVIQGTPDSRISGAAYNCPEPNVYKATFSMDVTGPTAPSGSLKYYYSRTRMNFVSTAVTGVSVSGSTATIAGKGTVNGVAGYTFMATVVEGSPDSFSITILKPGGANHYTAGLKAISGGNITISNQ